MHDKDHKNPTGTATEAAHDSSEDARPDSTSDSTSDSSSGKESDNGPEGRTGDGPLKRITGESRSLFDDLKAWVDLKIQLIQLDIEDRIRQAANQAALTAIVIVIGLLSLLFGLVAAGEALGAWLDSRSLGYLVLAVALALLAAIIHLARPRLVDRAEVKSDVTNDPERLSSDTDGVPALPEAVSAQTSDEQR